MTGAAKAIRIAPNAIGFGSLFYTAILGIVAFFVLYPAFTLFVTSFEIGAFTPNASTGFDNWIQVFESPRLTEAIVNTLTLSFVRQAIGLTVGIIIAWLIARTNLPMGSWLEVGFWIALFMPALPVTLSWVLLAGGNIGILNTFAMK